MVAETVPFAASRRIEFELIAPAPAFVVGDPVALGLLVRNLVDNAARYSPPGSRVDVAVVDDANAVALTVDDAGPGIPEAERQRVFDRFYRARRGRRVRFGPRPGDRPERRERARRDGGARSLAPGRPARAGPLRCRARRAVVLISA